MLFTCLLQAYCLYRRGKLKEALAALAAVPADQEVPRLQLEAQIQYRLGGNKEAIALYSQLYRSHSLESQEVQTNVVAAYVSGGRAGEVPAVMQAMKVSCLVVWWGGLTCCEATKTPAHRWYAMRNCLD